MADPNSNERRAEDDEFGEWCPDIGLTHDWGEWQLNQFFDLREDRFCSRCGGMETQTICTDPNCSEYHGG